MSLLRLEGVTAYYGHLQALHELSLQVDAGEMLAVIGANGAGKSTMLSLISGELRPREGQCTSKTWTSRARPPTSEFDRASPSYPRVDTSSGRSRSKIICSVALPPSEPAVGP